MIEELEVYRDSCPYCGEVIELLIDSSSGEQCYVEDCSVCCNPIDIRLSFDMEGEISVGMIRQDR
jgi:hypothetical protein